MRRVAQPPSRAEWAREGHVRGHTPAETIRYLSDCADAEDEQVAWRALPAGAVPADAEPFPRLRRWLGVSG